MRHIMRAMVLLVVIATAVPAAAATRVWSDPAVPHSGGDAGLFGVSCVTAQFCMAVGQQFVDSTEVALADEWNGVSWTEIPVSGPPNSFVLSSVSCTSETFCMAVGVSEPSAGVADTAAFEWNGSTWTMLTTPSSGHNSFFAVSCASSTTCAAVGEQADAGVLQPLAAHWNGSDWTFDAETAPAGSTYLDSLSCTSPRFCAAVGITWNADVGYQSFFQRWNGHRWATQESPPHVAAPEYVEGVSCRSPSWCVAVGGNEIGEADEVATVYRWDGTQWSLSATLTAPSTSENLWSVSCPTRTRCVASGVVNLSGKHHRPPPPEIVSWNGTAWTPVTRRNAPELAANLAGVSCVDSLHCAAVGYGSDAPIGLVSD